MTIVTIAVNCTEAVSSILPFVPAPSMDTAHQNNTVIGFQDDGTGRSKDVETTVLLMVLSGIMKNRMQPVAFPISKIQTPSSAIRTILVAVIQQLQEAGIFVKAIICDQGSNNVSLAHLMGASPELLFFEIDIRKVFFLYDTPHLMKCTKNNLCGRKLETESNIIDWAYMKTLYKVTHTTVHGSKDAPNYHLKCKLAKKLTERHIYRKPFSDMRVKCATQVMSESVSIASFTLLAIGDMWLLPSQQLSS